MTCCYAQLRQWKQPRITMQSSRRITMQSSRIIQNELEVYFIYSSLLKALHSFSKSVQITYILTAFRYSDGSYSILKQLLNTKNDKVIHIKLEKNNQTSGLLSVRTNANSYRACDINLQGSWKFASSTSHFPAPC